MRRAAFALLSAGLALGPGCGSSKKVVTHYERMLEQMKAERYAPAITYVMTQKEPYYGEDNRVLFYADLGYLQHMAGEFKASRDSLASAARAVEELWTQSVTATAASWIASDTAEPYQGEDFEKTHLYFLNALNFAAERDYEGALVEARRVQEELTVLSDYYKKELGPDTKPEDQPSYTNDAFAQWFIGLLRESEGDNQAVDDARVNYSNALDVYEQTYASRFETPVPKILLEDLARVAEHGGYDEDLARVKQQAPELKWTSQKDAKDKGQLVVLTHLGESAQKREALLELPCPDLTSAEFGLDMGNPLIAKAVDTVRGICPPGKQVDVAFPKYEKLSPRYASATVRITNGVEVKSETMQNLANIGVQVLEDRIDRVKVKAMVRALLQRAAGHAVEQVTGAGTQAFGAITNAASTLFSDDSKPNMNKGGKERIKIGEADLRTWATLPAQLSVGRVFLAPGTYTVEVVLNDASGNEDPATRKVYENVVVEKSKPTFIERRAL